MQGAGAAGQGLPNRISPTNRDCRETLFHEEQNTNQLFKSYPRLYVAKFLEVEENEEKGHVVILLQVDFKDGTLTNEVF